MIEYISIWLAVAVFSIVIFWNDQKRPMNRFILVVLSLIWPIIFISTLVNTQTERDDDAKLS